MADIWEILWLCNNYSLATPPYNSATIQAFQQTIQHTIQRLIYEYYALCYVLLLSYFSVWFWISTPPSHVKLPPDPLQNPAYFLSYLHNIQVFIWTYSWKFSIVIPSTRHNLFHTYSRPFPTKKHKAMTHPILLLFQQRKYKATTSPILHLFQQRNTKQQPHLFCTFSNKENTKQWPGMEIGVEAAAICFTCFLPFACPSSQPSLYWSNSDASTRANSLYPIPCTAQRFHWAILWQVQTLCMHSSSLLQSHMPLPFLERAMLPPKEALASPSTWPHYSTRSPWPVPSSHCMPSHCQS